MNTTKEKLKRIRDYMKYTSKKSFTISPSMKRDETDYMMVNKLKKVGKL